MNADRRADLVQRVSRHTALGDVGRLSVVERLMEGDVSPGVLGAALGMSSNLLAHHLQVLERAGLIRRVRSQADKRRSYLTLVHESFEDLVPALVSPAGRVLFVCTENAARSQLAAAIWTGASAIPVASAGTHPAARIHPGAVDAARRHGLPLAAHAPTHLAAVRRHGDIIVTVCDRVHEELPVDLPRRHWSVPDPARSESEVAFDTAVADLTSRITQLAHRVIPA